MTDKRSLAPPTGIHEHRVRNDIGSGLAMDALPIWQHPAGLVPLSLRTRGGVVGTSHNPSTASVTHSSPQTVGSNKTDGGTSSVALARLSLITVALLFGTLNVCLRLVYALPNPPAAPVVGLIRGIFAALCFAPSLVRLVTQTWSTGNANDSNTNKTASSSSSSSSGEKGLWGAAFWLGVWNVAAQGLLTVGLSLTSSSVRASFLAQSSVVITPLVSMMGGQRIQTSVWAGVFVAMIGLVVLATANDTGGGQIDVRETAAAGDFLVLGCAACWSIYLYQFGVVADRYDKVSLQAATCGIRSLMYVGWFLVAAVGRWNREGTVTGWEGVQEMWLGWRDLRAWALLLFSAVGSGAVAGVLQQRGQAVLTASESNIILSSEPIFAGICAWILLGELMSPKESLGGLIIFSAAVVATGVFEGLLTAQSNKKAKDSSHPVQ